MERETFRYIVERAARYPTLQRRGQLVRAGPVQPDLGRPTFFAGLVARAETYGRRAEMYAAVPTRSNPCEAQ
ncbi:hypothetical protein DSECCO2_462140 [anaerobic digester metagenome]